MFFALFFITFFGYAAVQEDNVQKRIVQAQVLGKQYTYSYLSQEEKQEILCYLSDHDETLNGMLEGISNLEKKVLLSAYVWCNRVLEDVDNTRYFNIGVTAEFDLAPPRSDVDFAWNKIIFMPKWSRDMLILHITQKDESFLIEKGGLSKILFEIKNPKSKKKRINNLALLLALYARSTTDYTELRHCGWFYCVRPMLTDITSSLSKIRNAVSG